MKVLLVTYSCAPHAGSEDGVGWNMLRTLSLHHEVVVVTRATFREQLEAERLPEKGHNVRFVYVSNPFPKESRLNRKFFQTIYYLWQVRAARIVRQITKAEAFDIVQHVTWIRCWMPSAILGAASGKLVWGPVGGVESLPVSFLKAWEYGRIREMSKKWFVACSRLDPLVRMLARKASLGLATTRESQQYMNRLGCHTELLSEIGLTAENVESLSHLSDRQQTADSNHRPAIRFISMGRLLGWKGFQYGIRAFCEAAIPDSEYWIVGDGPAGAKLRKLVADSGAEDRIRFWGRVPRQQGFQLLSQSDVLVHPSFRDSGGWVCLEAMAARKPVICLALGGPAVNVTSQTGTIVPAESPQQVVQEIARAMSAYASNRQRLAQQGDAGLTRITQNFTWEKKYELLLQHYHRVLGTPEAG